MRMSTALFAMVVSLSISNLVSAQSPGAAPPVEEHKFLKNFEGKWELFVDEAGGSVGTMESSMLGKFWIVNNSSYAFPQMSMKALQVIGFDPEKKKYVGHWTDSSSSYLWHYEGSVDESGNKLTLDARGPSMMGDGKMVNYQDVFEFKDEDTIITTTVMQNEDGSWGQIMTGKAVRMKED